MCALVCSSEDEASDSEVTVSFDKEHYAVDFDGRLDELQQLSVQDLQSILLGEADSFSRQDESQIAPTIQASTIEAEVTAASQHTVSEVQAPIQESSHIGSHMPELTKFRRCRMCSTRAKEKRTKYVCKVCKVPLCAAPCFYNFHNAE